MTTLVAWLALAVSLGVGIWQIRLAGRQTALQAEHTRLANALAARQLMGHEAADAAALRANVCAEYSKGAERVIVTNFGPADAFEVDVAAADGTGKSFLVDPDLAASVLPYQRMRPMEEHRLHAWFANGMQPPAVITVRWRDDAGDHEETFRQNPYS